MKPSDFLTEAAAPKVGRKYQHIEDLVLSDGSHGGLHAVERLKHMGEEGGSIELKWDGMPVVYWGRDEQGNFSLIPKNAWAYLKSGKTETSSGAPTVMRSPNDIKAFVLGTGSGDPKARQQFANQFASLWPYFEKISPKQGYLEGGLLFYPGTKPDGTSAMPVLNRETNTYDFTPNITTFHIPVDSELGKKIAKSKVMVAATGYYPTMGSSDEQRFPNAESLSVPGVIVQGTTYVQEPVPLDSQGLDSMEAFIKQNAKLIDNYLAPKPGLSNPGGELYTYLNKHLRTEGLLADFPDWARANLSAKKAETLLSDPKGLKATLGAVEGLGKQKNVLINQLSQGLHGGIKQTKPEGYAQAHPGKQFSYDIPGQFIKAIDQTNWSPKSSVVSEAAQSKKAVLGWGRGMGHTGHDALVKAVIHQAKATGATPYFVVSRSFGKDDPIPPETKLKMYQKKFPEYAKMFSLPTAEAPTLNHVLTDLASKGITDVTLVVGADQKEAFGYLTRPDKSGSPPYKNFGLNSLNIMSRQDTKEPSSDVSSPEYHEGPRATPMREVLLDPNKTEQEQFAVWRQAMSPALDDQEVLDMMNTAKQNLVQFHTPKPRRKASDIKEHIAKMRPLLKEATVEQQYKMLKLMKKVTESTLNEFAPDGFNGGDEGDEFSPEIAKMAQEDGFTKGASLADGATLERAMAINHWHSQHGGMYKQYFANGFKAGRMNKINHDNRQYNLNLKLMKDGSIRHGEQGVAEGWKEKVAGAAMAGAMATGAHGVVLNPARIIGPQGQTVANPYKKQTKPESKPEDDAWAKIEKRKAAEKKGVSERMRMGATIEPIEEDSKDEIHDYDKLDGILLKLCELVIAGQKADSEKYGMVAACVLDPKNRTVLSVNEFNEDGTRRHAERVAIDNYHDKYGEIPEGSIIITTCSPCSEHMSNRYGEDCTQLINDSGIKKVYAGFDDPTQPGEQRTFNSMVTSNEKIRQLCKKFAEQFLDMEADEASKVTESTDYLEEK